MATTPKQAREQGVTRYFTGKPCCNGHVAERMTSNRRCVDCLSVDSKKWSKDNKEKVSATSRAWRNANANKMKALKKAWNAANPEGQKLRSRKWYLANKEKANRQHYAWAERNPERAKSAIAAWTDANRGKVNSIAAKRRAALRDRIPAWSDLKAIEEVYRDASEFRQAGLEVDVDHFIPLQGELVSGLHVPGNLRVILSSVNRSKSNRFDVHI